MKSAFFVTCNIADENDYHAWMRLMAVALMFVATCSFLIGAIQKMGIGWKADSVKLVRCGLPLNEVTRINFVALKAIPYVIAN